MLIGEVAQESGVSARMLRHYDRLGLVSPTGRTSGGYRQYSPEDVQRLFHVEGLRSLGLSLQEVADVLDGVSFSPASMVERLIEHTEARLAREEDLLHRLRQVRASEPGAWPDALRTIGLIRGLDAYSPSTRQRLAMTLTDDGDRHGALVAEAALEETHPNVAGALTWALARIGDDAVATLADALDSPNAERRHRAVDALAKIGSLRARQALAGADHNPDPWVRARAILVRGELGDRHAVPALLALVVGGPYDVEAADALGVLASEHGCAAEVSRAIADALTDTDEGDESARLRLTSALAEIPGDAATTVLESLLDDGNRRVALTAAAVLGTRSRERR